MLKEPNTVTDEDKILAYYSGELEELPKALVEKRKIYDYILVQLLEHRPDKQIVELLKRVFLLARTQAYESIRKAKYVHGNYYSIDKGFELYRQLQDCDLAIKWASELKDVVAFTKAIEVKNKTLALIPDKEDLPLDKMGAKNYFMVLNMPNNSTLRMDMKNVEKLNADEKQKLLQEISGPMIDSTYEILEDNVRKSAGE